jgi:hypothetical protein
MGLILKSLRFSVDCGFKSVNRTIFVVNGGKNSLESSAWHFADTLCPFLKKVYKTSTTALTLRLVLYGSYFTVGFIWEGGYILWVETSDQIYF